MTVRVRVLAVAPVRPWSRPGTSVTVEVRLRAVAATHVRVVVVLLDGQRVVDRVTMAWRLPAGRCLRIVRLKLPLLLRHGYGLHASLKWSDGRASGHGAVEALEGWWQSPRHAAITTFRTSLKTAAAVRALRDWHVTVVQLYDWMYRHYQYEPPTGSTFIDTLGRRISHRAVRAGVQAGHEVGIASLAYGSVYGAEREYVDAHPDERVFDAAGTPLSLGETFFINDLRPDAPWRSRLMTEYANAVRRLGVDGIHMDTYGPPHHAFGADGGQIDFAAIYPGLIAEGAVTVAAVKAEARVLFNCVEGFPLGAIATAPAAALYLELWPPETTYADIVLWIERARSLGQGRAVVIAAYISVLRTFEADPERRAGAVAAAVLLTSIIAAAGAYHHVLAEHNRLLVEGYYPEARPLRATERRELQAAWAFTARYVHLLSDPTLVPASLDGLKLRDAAGRPLPVSPTPEAGYVWARVTVGPDGTRIIQLVDLLDQSADRWDDIRQPSLRRTGWRLGGLPVTAITMSPWTAGGAARLVVDGRLPTFRRWIVIAG